MFDLPDFENRLARDAYLGRGDEAEVRASKRRFVAAGDGHWSLDFERTD